MMVEAYVLCDLTCGNTHKKIRKIICDGAVEFEWVMELTQREQVSSKETNFLDEFKNKPPLLINSNGKCFLGWVGIKLDYYHDTEYTFTRMKPNKSFFQDVEKFLFRPNNIYIDNKELWEIFFCCILQKFLGKISIHMNT